MQKATAVFILNWLANSVIHDQPRILFLTKYARGGASSRYRTFLYLPFFEQAGIEFRVSSLFDERYLDHRHRSGSGSAADLFRAVVRRLAALLTVRRFDLVVFEKELLPYFPDLPERILVRSGVPYVVDIDDALFHQYDMHKSWMVRVLLGKKIAHVMRDARLVIAGNSYLADYAQRAGASRVEILPTVIDLERYRPDFSARRRSGIFTIGWIGSPSTAKYLQLVAPRIGRDLCFHQDACLTRRVGTGRNSGGRGRRADVGRIRRSGHVARVRCGNHAVAGRTLGAGKMWPQTHSVYGLSPAGRGVAGRRKPATRRAEWQRLPGSYHRGLGKKSPDVGAKARSAPSNG